MCVCLFSLESNSCFLHARQHVFYHVGDFFFLAKVVIGGLKCLETVREQLGGTSIDPSFWEKKSNNTLSHDTGLMI